MDEWERAFRDKSERRRQQSRWRRIRRRGLVLLLVVLVIAAGLWLANLVTHSHWFSL